MHLEPRLGRVLPALIIAPAHREICYQTLDGDKQLSQDHWWVGSSWRGSLRWAGESDSMPDCIVIAEKASYTTWIVAVHPSTTLYCLQSGILPSMGGGARMQTISESVSAAQHSHPRKRSSNLTAGKADRRAVCGTTRSTAGAGLLRTVCLGILLACPVALSKHMINFWSYICHSDLGSTATYLEA